MKRKMHEKTIGSIGRFGHGTPDRLRWRWRYDTAACRRFGQRLAAGLQQLRETLPLLPHDPYLLLNHNAWQSQNEQARPLPELGQVLGDISQAAHGVDLVGFYAAGPISRGFASSDGAFGWHQANSFNFDFSLFHANGEAVKASYAGNEWNSAEFARRFQQAREQLEFLGRPLHKLAPGEYRAYLAPAALEEIISTEPLKLSFIVPLAPEVVLGDYRAIRKPYEAPTVSDEEISEYLHRMQTSYATAEPVERDR